MPSFLELFSSCSLVNLLADQPSHFPEVPDSHTPVTSGLPGASAEAKSFLGAKERSPDFPYLELRFQALLPGIDWPRGASAPSGLKQAMR